MDKHLEKGGATRRQTSSQLPNVGNLNDIFQGKGGAKPAAAGGGKFN